MAENLHTYQVQTIWSGNTSGPAVSYNSYSRDHTIRIEGKPDLAGSADPGFRGDASRHNPEDLLVAALSACHMLWYLHLCTANGITVHAYEDQADGLMQETRDGGGRFTRVTLKPVIRISPAALKDKALALHQQAHTHCFIANSVNFPVLHEPVIDVEPESPGQ